MRRKIKRRRKRRMPHARIAQIKRHSISRRSETVKQPRGGYIPLSWFRTRTYGVKRLHVEDEALLPREMGMLIDYMTRYAATMRAGQSKQKANRAFETCIQGAYNYGGEAPCICRYEMSLIDYPFTCESVRHALNVVYYDDFSVVCTHRRKKKCIVDDKEARMVLAMVNNALRQFDADGGMRAYDFIIHGNDKVKYVSGGRGDYLTKNTLYDMKVSYSVPLDAWRLQIVMYYLMGLEMGLKAFMDVKYVGIANPRLNMTWRCSVATLRRHKTILRGICKDVIGYEDCVIDKILKRV